jgi:regulatory factor X
MDDEADKEEGEPANKKKKASSSSKSRERPASDVELRQLYDSNKARNLLDVADELGRDEKGPSAEKLRQIYAMIWYDTFYIYQDLH